MIFRSYKRMQKHLSICITSVEDTLKLINRLKDLVINWESLSDTTKESYEKISLVKGILLLLNYDDSKVF